MPNISSITVILIVLCIYPPYTGDQRQDIGGSRQEVGRTGQEDDEMRQGVEGEQEDGGMRQEVEVRQATYGYELDLLIIIFLIWMNMEGAAHELPHPVQAVEDPQEGLEEYLQRVVYEHIW